MTTDEMTRTIEESMALIDATRQLMADLLEIGMLEEANRMAAWANEAERKLATIHGHLEALTA